MQIELKCPCCQGRFTSTPGSLATEVLERMAEEGPWLALGDGETFEDKIFATLTARGQIRCPDCGQPVAVSEQSLGRLALEILASW